MLIAFLRGDSPVPVVASPVFLFAPGMLSHPDIAAVTSRAILREVVQGSWAYHGPSQPGVNVETIRAVVPGTLAYLAAGPVLLAVVYRRFVRLLDRPRRRPDAMPTPAARARAETANPPASPA